MVKKVFKFPDGKGGFILKILGDDEKWHLCDSEGNYLEEEEKKEKKELEPSSKVKKAKGQRPEEKSSASVRLSVSASKENGRLINDYIHWRSLEGHEYFSRSNFMVKATIAAINKDQEFSEYMKKKQ